MKRDFFRMAPLVILAVLAALLMPHCAVRQAPSGGPEDKTPPQVLATFPAADSTNIEQLEYIEIRFDEAVDPSSLRDQVWLLPEPKDGFEAKWKGSKRLRILLKSPLEKDVTYTLTIGTGVKDYRNNTLDKPFVLPFSTGDHIDSGQINGYVEAKDVQGVYIYVYDLARLHPDTAIFSTRPGYYSQVEADGRFQIGYLRPANYRVFALGDENRNGTYTLEGDRIGIPFEDVKLDSAKMRYDGMNFVLTREDTTPPKLIAAAARYQDQLTLNFSESLDSLRRFRVTIKDSAAGTDLPVLGSERHPTEGAKVLVYTAPQQKRRYLGSIQPVYDRTGNISGDAPLSFSFAGSENTDTTHFKLNNIQPADGLKNVNYQSAVYLELSVAADSNSVGAAVTLLGPDSMVVSGNWHFHSLQKPYFQPEKPLERGATYQGTVDLASLKSLNGKASGDSLRRFSFTTWLWADLGEISGTVSTSREEWRQAVLTAIPLRIGARRHQKPVDTNQPYIIEALPDGQYWLRAGIDVDGNGKLDAGSTVPFRFAEPFHLLSDTVNVRKRWTSEGKNFRF